VAATAGVVGETGERRLRLLEVKAGDTLFVDGGAGGVGAVTVQMVLARGARVIASAGEANHDYLREIDATPVRYGQGLAERVRAAAGGPVDAVFDVAGKTPVQELISLAPEPSQVVSIANYAAGQAGARVTGGGADSHPMQALGPGRRAAGPEQAGAQGADLPLRPRRRGLSHQPGRPRPRKACPRPLKRHGLAVVSCLHKLMACQARPARTCGVGSTGELDSRHHPSAIPPFIGVSPQLPRSSLGCE
jgi:hypothetical protein